MELTWIDGAAITPQIRDCMSKIFLTSFTKAYLMLDKSLDEKELVTTLQTHFEDSMRCLEASASSKSLLLLCKAIKNNESTIVGFAIWSEENEQIYLRQCVVAVDYWHQGIGTLLVNTGFARSSPMLGTSVRSVYLKTRDFNIPAIALYKKIGFVVVTEDIPQDNNSRYLCMKKTIE